jgi:hypothetical protein
MNSESPEAGIHYRSLSSDLSREKTQEVLSALKHRDILNVLRRNPIECITIARTGGKPYPAQYRWDEKTIAINSARKMGVHYGAAFRAGITNTMSAATSDKIESMRRSLLQETAHHIENSVTELTGEIQAAFSNPAKRPITQYAATSAREYFAETFVASVVEPRALADHDPVGSTMMNQAILLMRNRQ